MTDIYNAIKRIQELEREVVALRKRAEDAEYSRDALRTNNKELKTYINPQTEEVIYTSNVSVPFGSVEDYGVSWAQEYVMDNFKKDLIDHLFEKGYVKDLTMNVEQDPRYQSTRYSLSGKLKVIKETNEDRR